MNHQLVLLVSGFMVSCFIRIPTTDAQYIIHDNDSLSMTLFITSFLTDTNVEEKKIKKVIKFMIAFKK